MAWRRGFGALRLVSFVLISSVWGCGLENTGDAIFDPDRSHVDAPGQRIASGHYTRVGVDPFGPSGPALVGFRLDREMPSLSISPFGGAAGCEVQPAQAYGVMLPGTEPVRLLPYLERMDGNGFGTLRFIDHSCRHYHRPVEQARLPLHSLKSGQGFVARVADALLEIDPWQGTERAISSGFSHHEFSFRHHWLIEQGQLVVLDEDVQSALRTGTDVTELLILGQKDAQAIFVDEGALHVLADLDESPIRVDDDVCDVAPLAAQASLVYRSPCEGGSLVLFDLKEHERNTFDVSAPTYAFRVVRESSGELWTYYLTDYDPTARVGTLWVQMPGKEAVRIGDRADLSWTTLYTSVTDESQVGTALVDVDPVVRAGRLVTFDRAGVVSEIAAGVARGFRNGLLINFDGIVGDLARLPTGDSPVTVQAKGVPIHQFAVNADLGGVAPGEIATPSEAFLTEYSGAVGKLVARMVESGDGAPVYSQRVVSDRVPIGGFQMLQSLPGLGYLADYDAERGVGSLNIWNHKLDVVLPVHPTVSEFEEIIWPHDGLLYNVPEGSEAGIWFARAK